MRQQMLRRLAGRLIRALDSRDADKYATAVEGCVTHLEQVHHSGATS